MNISMYQASVPRLVNILHNLDKILDKAQEHVETKKLDISSIIDVRLFPDMFNMVRQVQIACETARGVVARLAGVEIPTSDDDEQNIKELKQRIGKTIAFIEGFSPEQIDGTED